jgi:AFG3 family protein
MLARRPAETDGLQSGSGAPAMGSGAAGAPGQPGSSGQYKFYFNIGSIDSFERKMEEAQEDLGWAPGQWVPITYTNELSWQQVRGRGAAASACATCAQILHASGSRIMRGAHGGLGST